MNESNLDFDSLKQELIDNISRNKNGLILEFFKQYLFHKAKYGYKITNQQFFDLIGYIMQIYPDVFRKKFANPLMAYLIKAFHFGGLIQSEQYLLSKYCLLEGEKIIDRFTGKILEGKSHAIGNIFLTNYRLIAIGRIGSSGSGMFLFGLVYYAIDRARETQRRKKTQSILDFLNQKPLFGAQFPIIGLMSKNLRYSSKKFSYKINIPYQEGTKTKMFKMNPVVIILKETGESGKEYRQRINRITRNVDDVMKFVLNFAQQFQEPSEPQKEEKTPSPEITTPNQTESSVLCPQCNSSNSPTDKFCANCGSKLITE